MFNSGGQPDINEIFELSQPIPDAYEFRPFEDFYRRYGNRWQSLSNEFYSHYS
jgi:hypothetical protein